MDRKRLLQLVVVVGGYCLRRCVSQGEWSLEGDHGMDSCSWGRWMK